MSVADVVAVAHRLAALRARIDAVDRPFTHPVRIVAVTKGHGPWAITAARRAGCEAIGENYAQELLAKRDALGDDDPSPRPAVHFIGRLQRNKVRLVADLVDVWETVDRPALVDELAKRAPGATLLVQVDTTGDPDKGGCPVDEVAALVDHGRDRGLAVAGLMTVGPTDAPPEAARAGFRQVRTLTAQLGLGVCSMGMSADLEIAVAEGSTEVRIGSALFGPRP